MNKTFYQIICLLISIFFGASLYAEEAVAEKSGVDATSNLKEEAPAKDSPKQNKQEKAPGLRLLEAAKGALSDAKPAGPEGEDSDDADEKEGEDKEKEESKAPKLDEDDLPPEAKAMQKEIAVLQIKRDKLAAEASLAQQILENELLQLTLEQHRISAELEIQEQRQTKEFSDRRAALTRESLESEEIASQQGLENAKKEIKKAKEIEAIRDEEQKLKAQNDLLTAKMAKQLTEYRLKDTEQKHKRAALDFEIAKIDFGLRKWEKEKEQNDLASREAISYSENPLKGRSLTISDRRIMLNGPIWYATADYVTERIHYFNNKDKKLPIFLVIDYSPGGSVMSGYRIMKAMEGSDAPVYVVLKSFAASMAATICTLAEKSYAYPNAIILHHQLSYGIGGNITQHSEMLEEAAEWYKRLAIPVADKMGITLEELVEQMYDNNSDGDWSEFADNAKKIKWVDHIIDEVRETGVLKNPDAVPENDSNAYYARMTDEKIDKKGRPYIQLPRLVPFDAWFMYNPDNYYRNWWE